MESEAGLRSKQIAAFSRVKGRGLGQGSGRQTGAGQQLSRTARSSQAYALKNRLLRRRVTSAFGFPSGMQLLLGVPDSDGHLQDVPMLLRDSVDKAPVEVPF